MIRAPAAAAKNTNPVAAEWRNLMDAEGNSERFHTKDTEEISASLLFSRQGGGDCGGVHPGIHDFFEILRGNIFHVTVSIQII